jgi:hypothetical protein
MHTRSFFPADKLRITLTDVTKPDEIRPQPPLRPIGASTGRNSAKKAVKPHGHLSVKLKHSPDEETKLAVMLQLEWALFP